MRTNSPHIGGSLGVLQPGSVFIIDKIAHLSDKYKTPFGSKLEGALCEAIERVTKCGRDSKYHQCTVKILMYGDGSHPVKDDWYGWLGKVGTVCIYGFTIKSLQSEEPLID